LTQPAAHQLSHDRILKLIIELLIKTQPKEFGRTRNAMGMRDWPQKKEGRKESK